MRLLTFRGSLLYLLTVPNIVTRQLPCRKLIALLQYRPFLPYGLWALASPCLMSGVLLALGTPLIFDRGHGYLDRSPRTNSLVRLDRAFAQSYCLLLEDIGLDVSVK